MSHGLTDTDSYDTPVTVPDPGDPRNAASVVVPFTALANRTAYFKRLVPGASDGAAMMPMPAGRQDTIVGGTWSWISGGTAPGLWVQTDISAATPLDFEMVLPDQITVTSVVAFICGTAALGVGAHAGLPATKPTLKFLEVDPGTAATTFSASVTDPSGTQAAYDAQHTIVLTTSRFVSSQFRRYLVRLTGEAGANAAILKLGLAGIQINYTHAP
jgi:hypothetical protein